MLKTPLKKLMVINIRKLYYYHKNSGLEVDFVMRYKGECTLVEVKADTSFIHGIFADGGLRVLKKSNRISTP